MPFSVARMTRPPRHERAQRFASVPTPSMLLPLAAVLAVGALLRLRHLGKKSLWLDEATSVGFARTSWPEFVTIVRTREANMVAYHLLLRAWIQLGTSEWVVRLLSALFSIATLG